MTMAAAFFSHQCGGGVELVLRSLATTVEMHELTLRNLDRLRRWEQWAGPEPTLAATFESTQLRLEALLRGGALPCAIRVNGAFVGAVDLSIDVREGTGELGYWVDAAAEGQGVAGLACAAVIEYAFSSGLARVEARIGSDNVRSRRLAERLGFRLEGTLRSAHLVEGVRQDVALYGMVAEDRALAAPRDRMSAAA